MPDWAYTKITAPTNEKFKKILTALSPTNQPEYKDPKLNNLIPMPPELHLNYSHNSNDLIEIYCLSLLLAAIKARLTNNQSEFNKIKNRLDKFTAYTRSKNTHGLLPHRLGDLSNEINQSDLKTRTREIEQLLNDNFSNAIKNIYHDPKSNRTPAEDLILNTLSSLESSQKRIKIEEFIKAYKLDSSLTYYFEPSINYHDKKLLKLLYQIGERYFNNVYEHEALSWYDWRLLNWGTKWDLVNVKIDNKNFNIEFQTAWSIPENGLIALAKRCGEITIYISYETDDPEDEPEKHTVTETELI
jgi:hypothetical protein